MRDSRTGGRGPAPLSAELEQPRRWARHFLEHGRRVWCEACGLEHRVYTRSSERLRSYACLDCQGRLRQARWFRERGLPVGARQGGAG